MNKDALLIITEKYPDLTGLEKKIADAIIQEPSVIFSMNINALASKVGTSTATVSRFASHIGFDNYKQMQLSLAKHLNGQDDYILNVNKSNDLSTLLETVKNAETDAIKLTYELNDISDITSIGKIISKADKIMFFGVSTSFVVGTDASLKFRRLKKTAIAFDNVHDAAIMLSCFNENDVVIGISHSGKTAETVKILQLAKDRNIKTIAITTFPSSKIVDHADKVLYTMTKEMPEHRISFSSRISQLFMLDSLFLSCLYEDTEKNITQIEKAVKNIEDAKY